MVEFHNTYNTCTISRNGNQLLYPFPLVVRLHAIDKSNGVMRALSFNYFNTDTEVDEFVQDLDNTFGFMIVDER